MPENIQDVRIDVELLKKDVTNITALCTKMDVVIDKILEQQDRYLSQVYDDMEKKKSETNADIKELHSRITTVDRSLSDKLELVERRIMEELKDLRSQITEHNKKEDSDFEKILNWKWMVLGGVIAISWLISNVNLEVLSKLFRS